MKREGTALITGAANGIGYASAMRLATEGWHVVVSDIDKAAAEAAAARIRDAGHGATALALDVGDPAQIGAIRQALGARFEDICILVNNAGISPKKDGRKLLIEEMTLDVWERCLRVNLTGALLLAQQVLVPMRARKWGRIVNMSSRSGRSPAGLTSVGYIVTKTGLLGMTRSMAQEFAADGITVNTIAPGRIETAMGANIDAASMAKILDDVPLKRWGRADEVADLVEFLASDRASYITGAVLDINGGVLMI